MDKDLADPGLSPGNIDLRPGAVQAHPGVKQATIWLEIEIEQAVPISGAGFKFNSEGNIVVNQH